MRYTLQVNTGSFAAAATNEKALRETLERWLDAVPAERVIYGWTAEDAVNAAVVETARKHGAQTYVWLPVFAEAAYARDALLPAVRAEKSTIDVVKGESFEFVCPSSRDNIEGAFAMLEELTRGAQPDGVFLDRIRYPSMRIRGAAYGCVCERCLAKYADAGADAQMLKTLASREEETALLPVEREGAVYRFADPDIDALFAAKRNIVTESVTAIAHRLREMGYLVGLDLFAPALADFVGQDIRRLSDCADMVKPMMYFSTTAPAGLPFEWKALSLPLQTRLSQLWGCDPTDENSLSAQLASFGDASRVVSVGLEVNRVASVCHVTKDDLRRRLMLLEQAGYDSATLCWNVLCAEEGMTEAVI